MRLFFLSFVSFVVVLVSGRANVATVPKPRSYISKTRFSQFRASVFSSVPGDGTFSTGDRVSWTGLERGRWGWSFLGGDSSKCGGAKGRSLLKGVGSGAVRLVGGWGWM